MKTFGEVKEKDYIVRVYGYKAESARVLKIEKISKDSLKFTVKGSETKKKSEFKVELNTTGFGLANNEKYFADFAIIEGIREGVNLGFKYARMMMVDSFRSVNPYFTVNKRNTEDLEDMNRICEEDFERWQRGY